MSDKALHDFKSLVKPLIKLSTRFVQQIFWTVSDFCGLIII